MSDAELRDQLITLLLAGHETSASRPGLDLPSASCEIRTSCCACARVWPTATRTTWTADQGEPALRGGSSAWRCASSPPRRRSVGTRCPPHLPGRLDHPHAQRSRALPDPDAFFPSALRTSAPTPTPGFRSAGACAAVWAHRLRCSRCGSCCGRCSSAASWVRPGAGRSEPGGGSLPTRPTAARGCFSSDGSAPRLWHATRRRSRRLRTRPASGPDSRVRSAASRAC